MSEAAPVPPPRPEAPPSPTEAPQIPSNPNILMPKETRGSPLFEVGVIRMSAINNGIAQTGREMAKMDNAAKDEHRQKNAFAAVMYDIGVVRDLPEGKIVDSDGNPSPITLDGITVGNVAIAHITAVEGEILKCVDVSGNPMDVPKDRMINRMLVDGKDAITTLPPEKTAEKAFFGALTGAISPDGTIDPSKAAELQPHVETMAKAGYALPAESMRLLVDQLYPQLDTDGLTDDDLKSANAHNARRKELLDSLDGKTIMAPEDARNFAQKAGLDAQKLHETKNQLETAHTAAQTQLDAASEDDPKRAELEQELTELSHELTIIKDLEQTANMVTIAQKISIGSLTPRQARAYNTYLESGNVSAFAEAMDKQEAEEGLSPQARNTFQRLKNRLLGSITSPNDASPQQGQYGKTDDKAKKEEEKNAKLKETAVKAGVGFGAISAIIVILAILSSSRGE